MIMMVLPRKARTSSVAYRPWVQLPVHSVLINGFLFIQGTVFLPSPMKEDELFCQLALSQVSGIGPFRFRKIVEQEESIAALFKSTARQLKRRLGLPMPLASAIHHFDRFGSLEKEWELMKKQGIRMVSILDPEYPQRLKTCNDAPGILFVRGACSFNTKKWISVIGTRNATEYGRRITEQLISELKGYDIGIVSGMAFGIDAIAHAVESAVATRRSELSQKLSREAFSLCFQGLPLVLDEPENIAARAQMQQGAAYAGAAIENSMLGAAHAAANPLTAHFDVAHGHAVGLMLPHVVRFNAADAATHSIYAGLAGEARMTVEQMADNLGGLLQIAGLTARLSELGVERAALPMLAAEAAKQWTAGFNPRPVGEAEFVKLYQLAFD